MRPELLALARATRGFMPDYEGLALYQAAIDVGESATIVEIGSYCGKSTIYLGAAAAETGAVVITVDHHRGSQEMQAGWKHHDEEMVNAQTGRFDSLLHLRQTLETSQLEKTVIAVLGDSPTVAEHLNTLASMVFIDGGHGTEPAHTDYDCWATKLISGGTLAIHDVFENPADGGRPPFEIYQRALADGFTDLSAVGSLRLLQAPGNLQ